MSRGFAWIAARRRGVTAGFFRRLSRGALHLRSLLLALALPFLLAAPATATDFNDSSVINCTKPGCSALVIHGTIVNRDEVAQRPWVGRFYVGKDECLFLSIVNPTADDETGITMAAIPPTIDVAYFDDRDFNGPNFYIAPTYPGWWVVFVQNADQSVTLDTDFTILYARYPKSKCP